MPAHVPLQLALSVPNLMRERGDDDKRRLLEVRGSRSVVSSLLLKIATTAGAVLIGSGYQASATRLLRVGVGSWGWALDAWLRRPVHPNATEHLERDVYIRSARSI
jgi:hypothetical protein